MEDKEYFARLKERGEVVKVLGGTLYHGTIFVADEDDVSSEKKKVERNSAR